MFTRDGAYPGFPQFPVELDFGCRGVVGSGMGAGVVEGKGGDPYLERLALTQPWQ